MKQEKKSIKVIQKELQKLEGSIIKEGEVVAPKVGKNLKAKERQKKLDYYKNKSLMKLLNTSPHSTKP